MKQKSFSAGHAGRAQFNMTPLIDVVFLLIIFFMLICQFIAQENYKLVVPDDCPTAITSDRFDRDAITVSVFPAPQVAAEAASGADADPAVLYAVRAQQFDPAAQRYRANPDKLVAEMAQQIKQNAAHRESDLVYLRADKDLTYGNVQNVLLALAQAEIGSVQIAAYRAAHNGIGQPADDAGPSSSGRAQE